MNAVDELNLKLGIGPRRPPIPKELAARGYTSIRVVGKGAFGCANLVFNEKSRQYSIAKEVLLTNMSEKHKAESHNEIKILSNLHHPNIVRYEECHVSAEKIVIVMEFADGGDLDAKIRAKKTMGTKFRPAESARIFSQTALALKYLHDRHILHRDLKTQNVFLTAQGMVKLGDFGISTVLQNSVVMAKTICGTPFYFSPELCQGHAYNNKSDIWALGCILYELLTLDVPFRGTNMTNLMKNIVEETLEVNATVDEKWEGLLRAMLAKDYQKRPSIDDVCRDPFLRENFSRLAKEFEKQAQEYKQDKQSDNLKHIENLRDQIRQQQGQHGADPASSTSSLSSPKRRPSGADQTPPPPLPIAGRRSLPSVSPPKLSRPADKHHDVDAQASLSKSESIDIDGPAYGRRSPKVRDHKDSVKIRKQKLAELGEEQSGGGHPPQVQQALNSLDFVIARGQGLKTAGPSLINIDKHKKKPSPFDAFEDDANGGAGAGRGENTPLPEQPHNAARLEAQCKDMASFFRSAQDLPAQQPERPWGDDWCTGLDLTTAASPRKGDGDGSMQIGENTVTWAHLSKQFEVQEADLGTLPHGKNAVDGSGGRLAEGTNVPSASTIEVRFAAAQALIATLTADLGEERLKVEKLQSSVHEYTKKNMALTEENLELKRQLRSVR